MTMASLNVAEWSPDQVAEWLKGLGGPVETYAGALRARGLDGAKLLTLRCDDLEYLGMRIIGHQELLLEAVDQLRNFQYEVSRECVQQLAVRVSVAAGGLARALAAGACDRLETHALGDVARAVHAVKALVCWVARGGGCGGGGGGGAALAGLRARAGALLALCLQAATCAQRDRFAEQPARAVAAAAAAAADLADHIIQEVSDPWVLQPASLEAVSLRQGGKPLGFAVLPSAGGHLQLAHIRFGSPAHASGAVHEGDEIVQVGGQCVVGWSGGAVERLCAARGAGELLLRLRRRGAPPARPGPAASRDRARRLLQPLQAPAREPPAGDASSSDSEPLSPPASPTLPLDRARMYGPPPRATVARRHSVSGGSPAARRAALGLASFWHELRRWRGPAAAAAAAAAAAGGDAPLYRRDKAVSCSTGLELSPRPRTCPGGAPPAAGPAHVAHVTPPALEERRGKLDKSHSTPAYDFGGGGGGGGAGGGGAPPLAAQPIPESPTTPADSPTILVHSAEKADQILDFKKSSSVIGEAILQQRSRRLTEGEEQFGEHDDRPELVETLNPALVEAPRRPSLNTSQEGRKLSASEQVRPPQEDRPPSPPPRPPRSPPPPPSPRYPALRPVCDRRPLTARDIRVVGAERRALPALNGAAPAPAPAPAPAAAPGPRLGAAFPASPSPGDAPHKTLFPAYKSKSLKKKNSLLAKRRGVSATSLAARGAGGAVWQRVRARHAQQPRWARRYLLLAQDTLYAYRSPDGARAACMIRLAGFTAAAAGEVKSRPHAFKVYHTGTAFYFACDTQEATAAWLDLITRATHLDHPAMAADWPKQFSETDYSSESDSERAPPRDRDRDRDRERPADAHKDKSKFGSLKKLTHRMQRSESSEAVGAASLDRKYLRFFSRGKHKDDAKPKSKVPVCVPVPTEHYRSYRRAPPSPVPVPAPVPVPVAVPAPAPVRAPPPPHSYLHASNPNLLEYSREDVQAPALGPRRAPYSLAGFVTLEEFMLKKQEEERAQVYTNRVLLGVERGSRGSGGASLRRRLARVVPDVLYGALPIAPEPPPRPASPPPPGLQARALPAPRPAPPQPPQPPRDPAPDLKPVSVKGEDGYEKIVYADERGGAGAGCGERVRRPSPPASPPRRRASPRRLDQVAGGAGGVASMAALPAAAARESGSGTSVSRLRLMFGRGAAREPQRPEPAGGSAAPAGGVGGVGGGAGGAAAGGGRARKAPLYPHLQCPPTFRPETYSLAAPLPPPPPE